MVIALHVGAAGGAAGDDGLAQHEVQHRSNAAGHDDADQHPEAHAHGAPGSILADIADHEHVEGGQSAPRYREVCANSDGWPGMMLVHGNDDPEEILRGREGYGGEGHGPAGYQLHLTAERERFGIANLECVTHWVAGRFRI